MPPKRTPDHILHDEFSAHEALDRAHLAATFFSDHVADHAFIAAHPKLKPAADRLAEKLAAFYQLVGRATFAANPVNSIDIRASGLRFSPKHLIIEFPDGRELSVPLAHYPTLARATRAQRNNWRPIGCGMGLHWPDLDLDLCVQYLLEGAREGIPKPPDLPGLSLPKSPRRRSA